VCGAPEEVKEGRTEEWKEEIRKGRTDGRKEVKTEG
jgi:hypothetical protein